MNTKRSTRRYREREGENKNARNPFKLHYFTPLIIRNTEYEVDPLKLLQLLLFILSSHVPSIGYISQSNHMHVCGTITTKSSSEIYSLVCIYKRLVVVVLDIE